MLRLHDAFSPWRTLGLLLPLALVLGCGGPPKEPQLAPPVPTSTAAEPEPEAEMDDSGLLDVLSGQPTEILLDGKAIGTTPISGHKVTPGLHEVTFVDEARGDRTMMVEVGPGEAKTVKSDPAPSAVDMGGGEKEKKE